MSKMATRAELLHSALKVINQLAWLAKDAEYITLQEQAVGPELLALAQAIAEIEPGAWAPHNLEQPSDGGWLACELTFPGNRSVRWSAATVPQPPGWTATVPLAKTSAVLRAGLQLAAIAEEALATAAGTIDQLRAARLAKAS